MMELSGKQLQQLKHQELLLHEKKLKLIENLPHRYGWKWYPWARQFYESRHQTTLLCAANQISKSSTQIRKCIEWATNVQMWPKLWKTRPLQFWYLYPSKEVANVEFQKKWIPEFMPRGEMKEHAQYGWKDEYDNKKINAVHFNTGVSVYFKSYTQDAQNLQTSTAHAIFCDEELPENIHPELMMRLAAVDGYFSMVFTATMNQQFWRRAIEGTGKDETMKDAMKLQVSMYDCKYYEDGSEGVYNEEKINRIKAQCGSDTEILRRVYGRFVTEVGRVYPSFAPEKHYISTFELRPDHRIYAGVDIGTGGSAHPPAIVFLAIDPDLKRGTIFRGWRGDGGQDFTVGDIMERFRELRGNLNCLGQAYDHGAKDFGTIAQRIGENFTKAEKSHEVGEGLINTLFRNSMLFICDNDELRKLGGELSGLMRGGNKNNKHDDMADALRYAATMVPWDFSDVSAKSERNPEKVIETRPLTEKEYQEWEMKERRGLVDKPEGDEWQDLEDEFDEWNENFGED